MKNKLTETQPKNIQEEEKYIQPNNIELVLSKEKKQTCREIVKEINNFGVSQRQKLFICELLALELEDPQIRETFCNAVKTARANLKEELIVDTQPKKKLIV